MKMLKFKRIIALLTTAALSLLITGCATYKSSFNCGDARGAYCASMDAVDQMIDSGEIENFNERRLNKKYKQTNNNVLPLKTEIKLPEITNYEVEDVSY